MDPTIAHLFGTHNLAVTTAIGNITSKLASDEENGEALVQAFAEFLDSIPADEVFDQGEGTEEVVKTAGLDDSDLQKLAEAYKQGQIFAHAVIHELQGFAKSASNAEEILTKAFIEYLDRNGK
jgi:hypothetical protein